MRFLDKGDGDEKTSESILDVGAQKAIKQVRWDQEEFRRRSGVYDWSTVKTQGRGGSQGVAEELSW